MLGGHDAVHNVDQLVLVQQSHMYTASPSQKPHEVSRNER